MDNLVTRKWIKYKNRKVSINRKEGKLLISNETKNHALIFLPKLYKATDEDINIVFNGNILKGNSATLMLLNRKREILSESTLNSQTIITKPMFKYYISVIKILPQTEIIIEDIIINNGETKIPEFIENFSSDILIITPSYPSEENRYFSGFVHSRLKEYKRHGINFDVAVVYDSKCYSKYEFEGIAVSKMTYQNLRELLQKRKYKKILVHFFDEQYYNSFEGVDLSSSEIFIWVHGPETLYWDTPLFTTNYFEKYKEISDNSKADFLKRDKIINEYNERNNIKWIFVSNWIKSKSEELLHISFHNYEIIPNIIDTQVFKYIEKTKSEQKNIFMLRRFDQINKYSIDVAVRAIVHLSKKENFSQYTFNIYGTGDFYEQLISPIKNFTNVNFYTGFFTHKDIAEIHKKNGIALFPTRYDAQGVSMCEAGSSGLVVISSDNEAVKEFIKDDYGNILSQEDYVKVAESIESIANDFDLFKTASKNISDYIHEKCAYEKTVRREIELIKRDYIFEKEISVLQPQEFEIVLTVVIPAYNVGNYILKTLKSLVINNSNHKYLEVIVVNDGSKDDTVGKVRSFIDMYDNKDNPIIKIIDKENGGHGSTINTGLENAKGKYFRIIDGDDWVNTKDFEKLINILLNEESDIVITDYSEDRVDIYAMLERKNNYEFMVTGQQYDFDSVATGVYGFKSWGPILATANIKTKKLQDANFKLSEKTFYVDMEFNTFYLPVINTITYYDLDVYRYFIGRINQSISQKSFVRNILHHEKVIININEFLNSNQKVISNEKKKYIESNILVPMIISHYSLLLDVIKEKSTFVRFDQYVNSRVNEDIMKIVYSKRIKILRKTRGHFINVLHLLRRK